MKFYNKLSLRNKITILVMVSVFVISSIGFSINFYQDIKSIKENLLSEKILTAKIVGSYSVTDIIFNNKETALESLSYLKTDKSIINANLYDESNQLFVSLYPEKSSLNLIGNPSYPFHYFEKGRIIIYEPIMIDENKMGGILLSASTFSYTDRINRRIFYFFVMMVVLCVTAFVVAGSLSKRVTRQLVLLTDAVKHISKNKNYSTQIKFKYYDETGHLIDAFNNMLLNLRKRESERDKAHMKLKQKEDDLVLILNNVVDGVITVNNKGIILTFNHAAEVLFGYTNKGIKNKKIMTLFPELFNLDATDLIQLNEKLELTVGSEIPAFNKSGDIFPAIVSVAELPIKSNENLLYIISCVDISQYKSQDEQLRRAQKMDALGKLTGGIAHDYNNMLGVIIGYAEILCDALSDKPELAKFSNQIINAGERGAKLTRKLLSFSRNKASDVSCFNINSILIDEQLMLEKTLTVRIKLIFNLDKKLWTVLIDDNDLEDAILNMAINAMHAIKSNGNLTISTHNEQVSPFDAQGLNVDPGDYVICSITDTGCGIPYDSLDTIFDPFYSTKGDKGTGLGLSQVYSFIKRSKGTIKVYSEVGKGTQFKIYLPRYVNTDLETITLSRPLSENMKGNETLLVVDDEPALQSLASEIFRKYGYKVFCAGSAKEALAILDNESIDLLFSDVIMPEMDGYQLAAIVKENYPKIKIQLASGFTDDRHKEMTDKDFHKNILMKPYNSHNLLVKIRELLD